MTIEEELLPEEKSLTNYHDDNAETCSETSESSTSSMDDIQDNSRRSMRETAKRESVDDDEMENVGTKKLVQQDFVYNKKENIYSDDNDHDDSDNSDSDENNDGVEDDDDDTSILISNTNKLLSAVGIAAKKIVSKDELARVAPSMFVAVYESLYHTRIEGIIRNPDSRLDYELNAQLVIDHLSDQINIDLAHISGVAIVAGNLKQLTDLIHIFMRIISLTR